MRYSSATCLHLDDRPGPRITTTRPAPDVLEVSLSYAGHIFTISGEPQVVESVIADLALKVSAA
jgi:hypothetical protein